MGKHYIDKKVTCEYYKHEDPQVIYCDGIREGTVVHLAFSNRSDAKKYKNDHCRGNCKECSMYKLQRN